MHPNSILFLLADDNDMIALEEIRLRQERQRQLEEKQRKLEELRKSEE